MANEVVEGIERQIRQYQALYSVVRDRVADEKLAELIFLELARDGRMSAYMAFERQLSEGMTQTRGRASYLEGAEVYN